MPTAEELVQQLRLAMENMTAEQRKAVFDAIQAGWCKSCGRESPCRCWDDE